MMSKLVLYRKHFDNILKGFMIVGQLAFALMKQTKKDFLNANFYMYEGCGQFV